MIDLKEERWLDNSSGIATIILAVLTALLFSHLGPVDFLIFVIAASMLALTLFKPVYGLSFLAFSIPFAGILRIAPKMTANKLFAGWVLIAFILGSLARKERIEIFSSNTIKFYFLFHFWILLLFPFGVINVEVIRNLTGRLFLLGLVFLITAIPKNFKQFQMICALTAAGSAFMGMYTAFFGMGDLVGEYGTRLAAGTNENVLAHALGVGLLVSFFALRKTTKLVKYTVLILDFFIIYAILLTGSRGTWIALIFSVVLFPIFAPGINLKKRFNYVFMGMLTIFAISWGVANNYLGQWGQLIMERLHEHSSISEAAGGRIDYIWPFYLDKFLEKPIIGWGLGFSYEVKLSIHNDLLWILVETGTIGFILFSIFNVFAIKDIMRETDTTLRLQYLILFIFLFISGLTHNTLSLKSYALAIGALCFLAKSCNKNNYNSIKNTYIEGL